MAKKVDKLNALFVKRVTTPGDYGDGNGLYLQVSGSCSKSWLYRYKIAGKSRYMGLGSLHDVPLTQARKDITQWRNIRREGHDPIEYRKAQKLQNRLAQAKSRTFGDCATDYIENHSDTWKGPKQAAQWTSSLAEYAKPINELAASDIDTALVLACIEPIWKTKTETATRVRNRIESILDYATVKRYRSGENPARWKGHLDKILPAKNKVRAVEHHPALPYTELPAFMGLLRERTGVAAMALELTILTGTRTSEVIGALWCEIEGDTWTIPKERMKAKKEHRVPLSERARAILAEMEPMRTSGFIFPGAKAGKGLSNMAMTNVLRRMNYGHVTVHGMRSAFRDWTAERTNTPNIVAEMALAHTISSDAEKAYRRGDLLAKRAKLMESWAQYCESKPGDVVHIGTGKELASDG